MVTLRVLVLGIPAVLLLMFLVVSAVVVDAHNKRLGRLTSDPLNHPEFKGGRYLPSAWFVGLCLVVFVLLVAADASWTDAGDKSKLVSYISSSESSVKSANAKLDANQRGQAQIVSSVGSWHAKENGVTVGIGSVPKGYKVFGKFYPNGSYCFGAVSDNVDVKAESFISSSGKIVAGTCPVGTGGKKR